ncbi:NPHP4 protein, partial [Nothoprocta ornata]|nr:NPHP4 protein [Nothoprocta ornata]
VYFHTSLDHPSITAVVEVVAIVKKQDGISQDLSCGFGIIHLFNSKLETTNAAAKDRGLKLYHGTPRALLHPLFQDPVEKNKYMTVMESSHLQYTLRPHAPLETIAHLFPENLLTSGLQRIPGVLPARGHTDDCFLAPRLMKPITCFLDKVAVHLYPSLEEFEEELLDLLNSDRLLKASAAPDGRAVAIEERRLRVGVHNGLAFVAAPQVAVLVPEAAVARGHPAGRGSRASRVGQALLLRSRIHLPEMVPHPAFAIVFQLEYVFSVPGGANGKVGMNCALPVPSVSMQVLRWAAWSPVEGAGTADVAVPLRGGARRSPGRALVYRERGASSAEVRQLESGTVQFHISTDSEEHLVTSTDVSSKEREDSERPPTPALSESALTACPPAFQLSLRQLSVSPARRSELAATPSGAAGARCPGESAALPEPQEPPRSSSPAGIAHLEAELGTEDGEPLRELPFVPAHAPVAAPASSLSVGSSTAQSRAFLAHLRASGFPEILDCNKEPVEVSDPSDPGSFSSQLEEADVLQTNEIILQFLTFTQVLQNGLEASWPQTVFFTFQFYRFPAVTTARLQLGDAGDGHAASPRILLPIREDGGLGKLSSPGLQLKYVVDAAFLKPGEQRCFVRYLAERSLHLDVWDGDSLLLVGSAAVKLQPLLRQGRAAVRSHHELDVTATEYEEDTAVPGAGALRPGGVRMATKGRLHLCLANVGKSCGRRVPSGGTGPLSLAGLGAAPAAPATRAPGRVSALSPLAVELLGAGSPRRAAAEQRGCHGQRICAFCSAPRSSGHEQLQRAAGPRAAPGRARLPAAEMQQGQAHLVAAYRERLKGEGIASMLRQAITSSRTVHAAPGTAAFFEFALTNPYNVQHTVTIEIEHPELSVIVDAREWRHFKELTKTATPVEEDMFQLRDGHGPQLYLRPRETVHVPFKYQTFSVEPAAAQQVGAPARNMVLCSVPQWSLSLSCSFSLCVAQVSFSVSGQKPIAILQVEVETQPPVVDQTFRFYHPELTFLKKAIRLPPWHTLPGAPAGMPGGEPEMFVRCSDPNVICETKHMGPGEPQDVFLKVAGGPSPQIKKFFVAIYTDAWLAAPVHMWQFYVHSVQRLDVSCVAGQLSRVCALLRGTPALRRVRAYTSHPHELKVEPDGVFILPPHAVQELALGVRPRQAGSRFLHLNVVDVERHQLVSSWLLCVSCRQPLLSKVFEIALPAGGGRGSTKRITYTNPYPARRRYFLRTSRPDLLRFQEDSFEVAGGEAHTIGLRFAPCRHAAREDVLIHINDHEDKNEETFCVTVTYE